METTKYENSTEQGLTLREQIRMERRAEAESPARRKQLIETIEEYLGYVVEDGPITEELGDIDYTFDFHEPESGLRIKVFKSFDEQIHRLYADCPLKPLIIYDSDDVSMVLSDHESDEELVLIVADEVSSLIYQDPRVFVYDSERLYMYGGHPEGDSVWREMMPFAVFGRHFMVHSKLYDFTI